MNVCQPGEIIPILKRNISTIKYQSIPVFLRLTLRRGSVTYNTLKPIFHCNANPFALGSGIGFCVTYTNMLISKTAKICVTPNAKQKKSITPNAKRKPMEYGLRWVIFALAMYILFVLISTQFAVEYGL